VWLIEIIKRRQKYQKQLVKIRKQTNL